VPAGAFKPGTTTENQLASSSRVKKVSWDPTTKVHFYTNQKVSWDPTTKVHLYTEDPLPGETKVPEGASKLGTMTENLMGNAKSYFGKFLPKLGKWRRS